LKEGKETIEMTKRLILGLCLLTLNASYLYTYQSPTIFYVGNLFLHLGLGIVLLVDGVGWFLGHPLIPVD